MNVDRVDVQGGASNAPDGAFARASAAPRLRASSRRFWRGEFRSRLPPSLELRCKYLLPQSGSLRDARRNPRRHGGFARLAFDDQESPGF